MSESIKVKGAKINSGSPCRLAGCGPAVVDEARGGQRPGHGGLWALLILSA